VRVAAGRDQLEQMPADKRAADEAEAAEALQNYIAQEQTYFAREKKYIAQMASLHRVAKPDVTQPVAPRPPQLQTEARRQHFNKWDGMRDASLNAGTVLRQEERAAPAPVVRHADSTRESQLAGHVPPPMSQAFTVGIDRYGHLDKQSVRAFLQSNGNPQAAQRALAKERSHVGDEEVTWGDDSVVLGKAQTHLKESGIRDLFKGVTGESGW